MLLPVFGSAGSVGEFALRTVTVLAETAVGPHELIHANAANDFSAAWHNRKSDNVIAFSDSPDARLVQLFSHADIPCSVFIEPGHSIVASVWEISGKDLWPMRIREASLAALHDLILSPAAMLVRSDARLSLEKLLRGLAAHYRLPMTDDKLAQALARLGPKTRGDDELVSVPCLSLPEGHIVPDSRWREYLSLVFEGFAPLLERQRVDSLKWPREVLLAANGDTSGPLMKPIDLTGPARTLVWGPYLNLPTGRWSVQPTIACSRNPAGCRMAVDVYTDSILAASEFVLPEEGTYTFELVFDVAEPRQAMELRFFLREGMIDGLFDLLSIGLARRADM